MDTYKLRVKIGEHEFDAEGPIDVVQSQFAAFREFVTSMRGAAEPFAPAVSPTPPPIEDQPQDSSKDELALGRITRTEGRVVSLTVRPRSIEDEILLLLLGQKKLRANDSVTGGEILVGLRMTGRRIVRVDYQLDKLTAAGHTITTGTRRARRYRLTNKGFARAEELARALVATV